MESLKPTPKMTAVGIVGAVSTLVVSISARFGVEISGEEGAAFAVILAFLAGYLKA